jgi:hypothetical protein
MARRFWRSPVLDQSRNKPWNSGRGRRAARCTDRRSGSAANRDLEKKARKRGNVRRWRPLFARKWFNFARFQADRTEVRDLNSLVSIEKHIARLHRPMQQSKAMRKPKPKRNSHNRLRFHGWRPPLRRI